MNYLQALAEQLRLGRVVPFVGSGVSLAVRVNDKAVFPSWQELLEDLANAVPDEEDANVVRTHAKKRRWLKAAEEALTYLNKSGFYEVMRQRFDIPQPADADWSLPDAVWSLQPEIVVTTNYDNVLTWRKRDSRRLLNDQPEELARLYREADATRPRVWHLHGHIERAQSLILAPQQYDAFYQDAETERTQYVAAKKQLDSLLANWTLLFIGFGMQDDYVMHLITDVLDAFQGGTGCHFALLKAGEADVERLWKEHNVRVIAYPDHGPPLVQLLTELAALRQEPSSESNQFRRPKTAKLRPVAPPAYTAWLAKQCSQDIELAGLRPKHGHAVALRNIYVPVITQAAKPEESNEGPMRLAARGDDRPGHELVQSMAAEKSIYISGPPGSGKTTFCRWLTYAVCLGNVPPHPIPPPDEYQEPFPEPLRGHLPMLIRLRDFWESLPRSAVGELTRSQLEKALEQWIARKNFEGVSWPIVKDHIEAGQSLLIFDGVDEVPLTAGDPGHVTQPRRLLLAGLADAVPHWTGLKTACWLPAVRTD